MATNKPGVVIFSKDYCSNQGLAAAHWASSVFPERFMERNSVRFLLVEESGKTTSFEDKRRDDKTKFMRLEQLAGMVQKQKQEFSNTFDDCIKNKFRKQQDVVVFTTCRGPQIQDILEEAIKTYRLDTLVIGMATLGSPCKNVDLLGLTAKCRVVLVNIEDSDQPPKTTAFNITPVPEVGTSSAAQGQTTAA